MKLENFNSKKTDEFCSSFYNIGLLYEYLTNTLQSEISERSKIGAAYREGEIWYLLESLLGASAYLSSNNVSHSDIRPYNVMLYQHGEVKLGEVFKNKQPLSAFSQITHNSLFDYYIAPELLTNLKTFKLPEALNNSKADVYSIGMTVLEAATL